MSEARDELRRTPVVDAAKAGERLDRFLVAAFPDLSRSRLKALLTAGRARAGGETITDPSYRVKRGQRFELSLPPPAPARPSAQAIPLTVVYEDAHLIVVDKPAGLVVHPAPGNPDRTLVNALIAHCGASLSGIGGERRPGIVHRLDKDTSGLLVAAKSDAAHAGLARQFAGHHIERAYLALVWGVPAPARGTIEGAIGRHPVKRQRMAIVSRGGKPARTRYRVVESFGGRASLVRCELDTGRTHQIRVHLASRGHPLLGDRRYGPRRGARERGLPGPAAAALAALGRQALHACLLGFEHPIEHRPMRFESALPIEIAELITILQGSSDASPSRARAVEGERAGE